MDVTCERCGTEYEFDETLVSDRGTTVKCTHCGHLFKVYRAGGATGTEGRPWLIRKPGGAVETLTSLRELQRQITRGELSEHDEISRSDDGWKRLGDIAELRAFFKAAHTTATSNAPASSPPPPGRSTPSTRPTIVPRPDPQAVAASRTNEVSVVEPVPVSGSVPPPPGTPPTGTPRKAHATMIGVGGLGGASSSSVPPPPASPSINPAMLSTPFGAEPMAPPASHAHSADAFAQTLAEPGRARSSGSQALRPSGPAAQSDRPRQRTEQLPVEETVFPRRAVPSSPALGEPSPRPLYMADEDERYRSEPRRGRSIGWIVVIVLLLAAGVGVALGWSKIAPLVGLAPAEDDLAVRVERGAAAIAQDHVDAYEAALGEYTRAGAVAENDPRVLTGLARTHALWSQALQFRADDLDARGQEAQQSEASRLREQGDQHAEDARRYAESALRQDPASVDVEIALSDALRASGDLPSARTHLDRARELRRDPSADLYYVSALIEIDASPDNVAAGRADAQRAVEKDPNLVRARLLLARALLAGRDVAGARQHIDFVLDRAPDHPEAHWLDDAIRLGVPPAPPVVQVLDAGTQPADAGLATPPVAVVPPTNDQQAMQAGEAGAPGATPTEATGEADAIEPGHDLAWYIRRGDDRLERNDPNRARRYYEAALTVRPGAPEALTGLGYVSLHRRELQRAVTYFQQSANRGYALALIGLGQAHRELNRAQEAIDAYEQYLDRDPSGPKAHIARHWIAELQRTLSAPPPSTSPAGTPPAGAAPSAPTNPAAERMMRPAGEEVQPVQPIREPGPITPPERPAGELPAPRGTDPANPPPSSDPPAVGNER